MASLWQAEESSRQQAQRSCIRRSSAGKKQVAWRTGLAKSGGQERLKADQTSVPERSFAIQYVDTFENVLGNHADLDLIILGSSGKTDVRNGGRHPSKRKAAQDVADREAQEATPVARSSGLVIGFVRLGKKPVTGYAPAPFPAVEHPSVVRSVCTHRHGVDTCWDFDQPP